MIAGGGTGGHLFPGLAVAEELAAREGAEVVFIGSSHGIEARVIPQTRFAFHALEIAGLRGRGVAAALRFAVQIPLACIAAWRHLGQFRPNLVMGLGGYSSVPVVLAAWARRVPIVLLEQNAHAGMSNRLLARLARAVCTTFVDSDRFFPPGKATRTGNPVRHLTVMEKPASRHFTVLAFGGSQGARSINQALMEAAPKVHAHVPDLQLIHQTGGQTSGQAGGQTGGQTGGVDVERVRERYRSIGIAAEVLPFIDDMGAAYAAADLVLCRSGATTLAELTALGKPSILVPYPYAADDHQRANAEVLTRAGAARMILDADLNGESLAATIIELATDTAARARMSQEALRLAVPDAASRVVDVCRRVQGEVE